MAHPYHHALSSVKKWGGTVDDFMAVHAWSAIMWTARPRRRFALCWTA